ncbi:ubiquinol-cytochrome c reductase iron-sulfur subunit [Permianibacter aggregans]|uniref:Ubiquinol-cytochrome c reductase iron-sulfur subunit n=1 Tax=Permianibacter aggregans TaxID=1510150 RepID=A0A4R6UI21_9GAMM|nr:ubiquinol-cytochrome c reductase iron-sulfur subunit [Permianibacter aggregans]QGX39263.1 ubiquinol-cytochrome c reductase iron-sulfur subunit [Permianibacter aggregans]TDQ46072.1 ubiquinol-cytochrome c reductase iron-sulfur subunit [Permianibacter aggregans]
MAEQHDGVDLGRRRVLTWATAAVGAVGAGFAAVPFIASWRPSARAQAAGAPVEVDVSKVELGGQVTVPWRGQPVVVVRRTPEMVTALDTLANELRDPDSNESMQPEYTKNASRAIKPEYFVAVRTCTHLRCVPLYQPDKSNELVEGGFYCPCHGSKFDLAGRVYKGVPAPTNLDIPPYSYIGETTLLIGVDQQGAA